MNHPTGGPLEKNWWPIRMVLWTGFLLFRLVERVAPRLTDLLGMGIDVARRSQQKVRVTRRDVVTMRVAGTRFRLCIGSGHQQAHHIYLPLAAEGRGYEPLAAACLTRVPQRLPDPAFMDVGAFVGHFTCYAAALLRDRHQCGRLRAPRLLRDDSESRSPERIHASGSCRPSLPTGREQDGRRHLGPAVGCPPRGRRGRPARCAGDHAR